MTSIDALKAELRRAEALPVKERRKQARSLGFMALELEKAQALQSSEELEMAISALAAGAMAHSYPQRYHMGRARLMKRRRAVLNLPEPVIAQQKAKTIDVEAGGIWLEDPSLKIEYPMDDVFHQHMNRLEFYFISFGGDGRVKLRLRIHQSGPCEPQSTEFRRLCEATQEAVLAVPSGKICAHGGGAKKLELVVPPGDYKIAAFGLGIGRSPECLVLISPLVGDDRPEPLVDTPELQL